MTIFFPSHSIIIKRYKNRGGIRLAASATFTGTQADIQPIGGERVNDVGGRIGKTYEAWVDVLTDVKESDLVVSAGRTYAVKSVSTWAGAGLLDHKYLILESQD